MKQFFLSLALTFCVLTVSTQKDVTRFLGIPVDGTKLEMKKQLEAKGFSPSFEDPNILEGEFNGMDVHLHIVTNNNKVYRIMVADAKTQDEGAIKIRYNNLCRQFENNSKYMSLNDYTIGNEEDISYEITVHSKRYDAQFYQKPLEQDSAIIAEEFQNYLLSKYTQEQLENPTEEIAKDIFQQSFSYAFDKTTKKSVWFTIADFRGEYYIVMYYDNEYNKANGEDL